MSLRCALVLTFGLAACSGGDSGPAVLKAGDVVTVVEVKKGDELEVDKDGKRARVRILGVHAFSEVMTDAQVSALSAGSVSALGALVKGQPLTLSFDVTPQDDSGRYLAYVEAAGADVGQKLVEDGWAVVYTEYPFAREAAYLEVEKKARGAARNIWGLKPAADLVVGLRKQWGEARASKPGASLVDPLAVPQ